MTERQNYLFVLNFRDGTVHKEKVTFNNSESAEDYLFDVVGFKHSEIEWMITTNGDVLE